MTNNQVKTNGQIEYERRAANARANKPNAHGVFNSSALTLAGSEADKRISEKLAGLIRGKKSCGI